MARFEDDIEVGVPVRVAYDQWTQFESFPQFMHGVESVTQDDDRTLTWVARIAGRRKQWTATITDQVPDALVSWTSTSGARNAGTVVFEPLGTNRTRVSLAIDAEPDGIIETAGANFGVLEGQVKADLEAFKQFIENRQVPTGAWRGEIHPGDVRS